MKKKIYLETSVVSYYVSKISTSTIVAGRQASTTMFWNMLENFDVYISNVVIREASKGDNIRAADRLNVLKDFYILKVDDVVQKLAQSILNNKAIPSKYTDDALHIAIAAKHGIDIVVTWNCKHINNPVTRGIIREIVESQ